MVVVVVEPGALGGAVGTWGGGIGVDGTVTMSEGMGEG